MREGTNGLYPAFVVWENVPGAFSSNKGEDFRSVLQALIEIVEPGAVMPPVPKKGWAYADCYCGDGWSLAWRTFDAQYWGVPQRRRRIYLVLDLRGQRAGKILFERNGLQGDFKTGAAAREEATGRVTGSAGRGHPNCLTGWDSQSRRIYGSDGVFPTLSGRERAGGDQQSVLYCLQGNMIDRDVKQNGAGISGGSVMFTLNATDRHGICSAGFTAGQSAKAKGIGWKEEQAPTLRAGGGLTMMPAVICRAQGQANAETCSELSPTLMACHDGPPIVIANHGNDARYTKLRGISTTVTARYGTGGNNTPIACKKSGAVPDTAPTRWIIRRLTPTECARLQGFPDGWGAIKDIGADDPSIVFWREVYKLDCGIKGKNIRPWIVNDTDKVAKWHNKLHTDRAEYKMWGNGIALPNALYVMEGIAEAMGGEN